MKGLTCSFHSNTPFKAISLPSPALSRAKRISDLLLGLNALRTL